jgi:signal transduction histidine kinase
MRRWLSSVIAVKRTNAPVNEKPSLARLVSLATHDLRTPLATVSGFAKTLIRTSELEEPAARYVAMIEAASAQMVELLDELGLVARIDDGRYQPTLREQDTRELAEEAAERLGADRVQVGGDGGTVRVDVEPTSRAVSALAQCALRHGGLDTVELRAEGPELLLSPITPASAPVVLGEDVRDLGAAVAGRLIEALGGSLELADQTLRIRLPE